MALLLGFLLGMCAGFRSMTPLAAVAWAAQSGWPALRTTPLAFLAAPLTAYLTTAFAAIELVTDKLSFTPSRLTAGPFGVRILVGGLLGAAVSAASQQPLVAGAIVGAIGGAAGSFAGYHARHALVSKLQIPDIWIALLEDAVTIGLAMFVVSRVGAGVVI